MKNKNNFERIRKNKKKTINKEARSNLFLIFCLIFCGILMIWLVGAIGWIGNPEVEIRQGVEDAQLSIFLNLSEYINATEAEKPLTFGFGSIGGAISNISSTWYGSKIPSFYTWISINSITGFLTINSTRDNETGMFNITIDVKNKNGEGAGARIFTFTINATNDPPAFNNFPKNLTRYIESGVEINITLSATDEEGHYPLIFSVNVTNDCKVAEWSPRFNESGNNNCTLPYTLLNRSGFENTTKILSFQNLTRNDTGVYNITICINDTLPTNESLLPTYRMENYTISKQTCENLTLDLRSPLLIRDLNCSGISMADNETKVCQIEIETENYNSNLTIWSVANFTDGYSGGDYNISWFYSNTSRNSENYIYLLNITLNPGKREIGMWDISFWAHDSTPPSNLTTTPQFINILINVTHSSNETPILSNINALVTSINKEEVIYFNVSDNDLLIPDKRVYNESFKFRYFVLNQADNSQILSNFSNFSIINLGRYGNTNASNGKIVLFANSSESGAYTINLSVEDNSGKVNFTLFNLTILNNVAPKWNLSKNYSFEGNVYSLLNNTNFLGINLSAKAYDEDGDQLSFSYANVSGGYDIFNSTTFNSTSGIINLTLWKNHAGYFNYSMIVSDGYLTDTVIFSFNISNENSAPNITKLENGTGAIILRNGNLTVEENENVTLDLEVNDEDFLIKQKSYYNESISFSLIVENTTSVDEKINFSFRLDRNPGEAGLDENKTSFKSNFTPSKSNVGNYKITINASDKEGASDIFVFNLTVTEINNPPQLIDVTNITSAFNRSFYLRFCANDTEDGYSCGEGNNNFKFDISNISGINILENELNETTGEINITFNESHAGKYQFNISVNDSGIDGINNLSNSRTFWIFVYDFPNITSPNINFIFNGTENATIILNFTVNHSLGDNLTYELWMDDVIYNILEENNFTYQESNLRDNLTYYGNNTLLNWNFTLNFTDETYGLVKNITLIVYPSNNNLENASKINTTKNWKINITHTNAPVIFWEGIRDQQTDYNQEITINLSNHFSDADHEDSYYAQIINFSVLSNVSTNSNIKSEVSNDWILTLSTIVKGPTNEKFTINATDLDANNKSITYALSNEFEVKFTDIEVVPPVIITSTNTVEVPISLKIIVPGPISAHSGETIIIPISLYNSGKKDLKEINLSLLMVKEGAIIKGANMFFSQDYFSELKSGEIKETKLTINVNLTDKGLYEITINATVKNPKYVDWGKIQILIEEGDKLFERIIFAEELIAENPECLEIKELIDRAKTLYNEGKIEESIKLADSAIQACKEAVSQALVFPRSSEKEKIETIIFKYLEISVLLSIVLGIFYYYFKRARLKNNRFKTFK